MYQKIRAKDLVNISDRDMMKVVFSSGDYFPGFYRFTMGTQKIGDESLSLSTLIWLYYEQTFTASFHHREDWLELQHEVYDRDVASETARNFHNTKEARSLLSQKMFEWYDKAPSFDVIYLNTLKKAQTFEKGVSYYFMGSLLKYENNRLIVGYNKNLGPHAMELKVTFEDCKSYIDQTFTKNQFNDLFLHADLVAVLNFNEKESGVLSLCNNEEVDDLLLIDSDVKVFASPSSSRHLPIRFAKTIRLSNFKRGENGKFQVWKSDQNW